MIGADRVAAAFGLATGGRLSPLRHGDLPTWTLITTDGRFVIKQLTPDTASLRHDYVRCAMTLERRAAEAGLATPRPVDPIAEGPGWATEIDGHGWFRAHDWIDHHPLGPADEISGWLGDTLARLHRLQPFTGEPDWPSIGVVDRDTWRSWVDQATTVGRPWAELARTRLPYLAAVTDRLRERHGAAPDWVVTHGDLDRHNVLIAAGGPVLIDWDTVWPYSAALQAGHVALRFGFDRPERSRAILDAYRSAGGDITWAGDDLLLSAVGHRLAALSIRVAVSLGQRPAPRWCKPGTTDQRIGEALADLPDFVATLDARARALTARGRMS